MAQRIPPEVQAQINDFNRAEAAKTAPRPKKVKDKDRRQEERLESGAPMNFEQVEQLARQRGLWIESGGNHLHLVGPDGRRCSIPRHSGHDLATGTLRNIMDFLNSYAAEAPVNQPVVWADTYEGEDFSQPPTDD